MALTCERKVKQSGTHSLSFDGSNDYVSVTSADNPLEGTGSKYIVAKFLSKEGTTNGVFHTGANSAGKIILCRGIDTNGKIAVTSYGTDITSNKTYELNKWHEAVYVFNQTHLQLYVNGVLDKELALNDAIDTTDGNWSIGTRGTEWFNGDIANIRIGVGEITAQQVSDLYTYNIVPDSCVAEYFNSIETDGAGTVLTDSIGSNNGTISGATWTPLCQTPALPSGVEHVLSFDTNTDDVTIENSGGEVISDISQITFRTKIKQFNLNGASQYLFSIPATSDNNRRYVYLTSSGFLQIRFGDDTQTGLNATISQRVEHDLVVSFDKTNDELKVYLDGVLTDDIDSLGTIGTSVADITFGNQSGGASEGFVGSQWDNSLWDRILTAQQVYDMHKHNIIPTEGLVGNWDRISDDGTTLIDNSGNGNDGTITGATRVTDLTGISKPSKAIVPYVGSVSFDGSNDQIVINDDTLNITDEFTVEAKVLFKDVTTDQKWLARGGFIVDGFKGWILGIGDVDGKIDFETFDGSNPRPRAQVERNTWHKIVARYNASTVDLYVDGVLVASSASSGTGLLDAGSRNFTIGANDGSGYANINVASVKIYNQALTTEEVEQLYLTNTTPYDKDSDICVLNLEAKTDVLSGSSWRDVSGNDNHGTITGATLSSEAPSKAREVIDGNLVFNGDFAIAPYLVAETNVSNRWIDGTSGGSITNNLFGWGITKSGTVEASFVENSLKLSTTASASAITSANVRQTTASEMVNATRIKPNTDYRCTFKMKTNYISGDSNDGAYLAVRERNASATNVASTLSDKVKITTDWIEYTLTFTSNSAGIYATIQPTLTGNTGDADLIMDAYFKDIKLEEI